MWPARLGNEATGCYVDSAAAVHWKTEKSLSKHSQFAYQTNTFKSFAVSRDAQSKSKSLLNTILDMFVNPVLRMHGAH